MALRGRAGLAAGPDRTDRHAASGRGACAAGQRPGFDARHRGGGYG
jgi:hypothetical protein